MSIQPPNGILDITGATLRVSKMEFSNVTGFDTVLNNVARNTVLHVDTTEYTANVAYAVKPPNMFMAQFDLELAAGGTGLPCNFNYYNDSNLGTSFNGYNLSFNDTSIILTYDGGSALHTATLSSSLNNGVYRKVKVLFDRDTTLVSINGENVFRFKDELRPRTYDTGTTGYIRWWHNSPVARKIKNLKVSNGEKWAQEYDSAGLSSNISYTHGLVGVGTSVPEYTLDVAGDIRASGNLIINGSNTLINTTSLAIEDGVIECGKGNSSAAKDLGFLMVRNDGSSTTNSNVAMFWDESTDALTFGFSDSGPTATTLTPNTTKTLNSYFVGNVGIGTASPLEKLDVYGTSRISSAYPRLDFFCTTGRSTNAWGNSTGAAGDYRIYSNGDASDGTKRSLNFDYGQNTTHTTRMCINADGNVGVGTASPGRPLEIAADGGGAILNLKRTNAGTGQGALAFVNLNSNVCAAVSATRTGAEGGNLVFHTIPDDTTLTSSNPYLISERMRITSGGNVGIGVASPAVKLDVAGSSNSGKSLQLRSGDSSGGTDSSQIIFSYGNSPYNSSGYAHSIRTRHNSNGDYGNAIDFWLWNTTDTTDASTLGNKRVMTIEGNGNVGVGTASPGEKLHVHENLSTSGHQICARIGGSASSTYSTLVFGSKDGRPHIGGHKGDYGAWHDLSFQNDLMVLKQSNMRVGINTTSPAYPLDVSFAGDSGAAIRSTTSHASLNFFPSSGYSYLRFNEGNGSASVWLQALSGGHLAIRPQGGNETFRFTSGGDMNCNYGDLNFGNRTTQHINLWGTDYGIGVQSNTLYFRSSDHFVFHENGTHSDSALDPGSGGALRMVIRSGGNVGINTATPGSKLHVHQGGFKTTKVVGANTFTWDFGIGNSEFFLYKPGSTGVYLAWGHTAWSANSDSRLKKNIVEIESGLQKLRNIRPVLYHLKNGDSDDAKKRSGFIAQDWLEQQPECVTHSETDNMMGIAYTDTIPVICAATKELDVNQQKIKEVIDNLSDFTGHHRCLIKNILPSEYAKYEGLIASANNNEYMNHDGSTTATINEALPVVSLTTKEKDKSCLGVISLRSDPESHLPDDPTRVKINAVGEGGIWVTDINGPLESGDYITTSNVSGYGMKQESEFLANYTVAKVTQDCDFTSPIRVVKNVTKELSNVTYYTTKIKHSITREEYDETQASIKDIEYSNVYVKYELDYLVKDSNVECDVVKYRDVDGEYTSNVEARHTTERWKTKREFLPMDKKYDDLSESEKEGYVLETKTTYYRIQSVETKIPHPGYQTEVRQEWVNVLDEHGQLQWEDHPTETEKAYKIRYLDADGKITTEANKVYTAAFVGCTYHCG
jgi:hypothetical protein